MTNVRAVHHADATMKTACGRVLGLPLKGGAVYLNGTHRLIVTFGTAPVTCGKCQEMLQRVAQPVDN